MGNTRKKAAKKKERERRVTAEKHSRLERELSDRRAERKFTSAYNLVFKSQDDLNARVLLDALEIASEPKTIQEAQDYLTQAKNFCDTDNTLFAALDELFQICHDIIPPRYASLSKGNEQLIRELARKMQNSLDKYEKTAEILFETRIAKELRKHDDIELRLEKTCKKHSSEIQAIAEAESKASQKVDPHDEGIEEDLNDPELNFTIFSDDMIENVTGPHEHVRRFQEGITSQFYYDITDTLNSVGSEAAIYLLREIYEYMSKQPIQLAKLTERNCGVKSFRIHLRMEPEKIIPDPDYLESLTEVTKRLDTLQGADTTTYLLKTLTKAGMARTSAVQTLEKIGKGQLIFIPIAEAVRTQENRGAFLIQQFAQHPEYLTAYQKLREAKYTEEQSANFLTEYGDYLIGDRTFAKIIAEIKSKEAVKLLADNGIYICCTEGTQVALTYILEAEKPVRTLETYINFAREEKTAHCARIAEHVRTNGSRGIEKLVEQIEQEQTTTPIPTALQRHADIIKQYHLVELYNLSNEQAEKIATCIDTIKSTRYEPVLLGQKRLLTKLMTKLEEQTLQKIQKLPSEGNPYIELARILEQPKTQKTEKKIPYERIVIVTYEPHPDVVTYIEENAGKPVRAINCDTHSNQFETIQKGDLVVYSTRKTGHDTYNLVRKIAEERGVQFRHCARRSKQALLRTILVA